MSSANLDADAKIDKARELLKRGDLSSALNEFLKLSEEGYRFVSPNIGWIYAHLPERDIKRAIEYYKIGSDEGDTFSQHALGGLYYELHDFENAVKYYDLAVLGGRTECLFLLHFLHKQMGDIDKAKACLLEAVRHGDPLAIRNLAFEKMAGRQGLYKIFEGVYLYFTNLPKLIRLARRKKPD